MLAYNKIKIFSIFGFLVLISLGSRGQGNLMIYPQRIVIEGQQKFSSLGLSNMGDDTSKYLVSIVNYRMREDGGFDLINEPDSGQDFAEKYIRIYPRNVVMGPHEEQRVKVQLISTNDLQPGEYRSHLYFRAQNNEIQKQKPKIDTQEVLAVKITPVFGITIPVIIRIGQNNAAVNLEKLSLIWKNDTTPAINYTFHRTGDYSVYGDVTATWISPSGREHEVGIVKGIAVYTPGTIRHSQLVLKRMRGVDYSKGKLVLRYNKPKEEKGSLLAEAMLELH